MSIESYLKLYTRDSKGKIRVWWVDRDGARYRQNYGLIDGKIVTTEWTESEQKNVGKANETSKEDQARLEVEALITKQLKLNYFRSVDEVDNGFLEPQLAKPCKDYIDKIDWTSGQIIDHKLNGICCASTKIGAFSRRNEEFFAIPHIREELDSVFREFPKAYLHGELYNPLYVNELNKIAELVSVVRKEKDINEEVLAKSRDLVQYHLYDGYGFLGLEAGDTGLDRRTHLEAFIKSRKFNYIKCVTWKFVKSKDDMELFYKEYVNQGGEGVIIRNPKAPYQHKRTKDLLKYKKSESAEFKVISVEEGDGNWKGCAKFVWLELPNGVREQKFKSNIKGSQEKLREAFNKRDEYVGKEITVEYQEMSPYNVPLIPYTDLLIRSYE